MFKIELNFDHEVIKGNLSEEVTGRKVFTSHVTGRSLLDEGPFPVIVGNSEKEVIHLMHARHGGIHWKETTCHCLALRGYVLHQT